MSPPPAHRRCSCASRYSAAVWVVASATLLLSGCASAPLGPASQLKSSHSSLAADTASVQSVFSRPQLGDPSPFAGPAADRAFGGYEWFGGYIWLDRTLTNDGQRDAEALAAESETSPSFR